MRINSRGVVQAFKLHISGSCVVSTQFIHPHLSIVLEPMKCGTSVQMQLKRALDLILLQLLDHIPEKLVFPKLAFDPMSNSSRLFQPPPEVDLTIPKTEHYSNSQMVPPLKSDLRP
jgi:hypothetical protein